MEGRRMLRNNMLRGAAIAEGLSVGSEIIIRERSILKDGSYITRKIRRGMVCKLYPYHFYCRMADGQMESFRYNEFLGYESRLVRLQGSKEAMMTDRQLNMVERASCGRFFLCENRKNSAA
jgi:hypothetical protein